MASSCGELFHGLPRCQDLLRRCFWAVGLRTKYET
ncbi:hypothetical protein SFR_5551 [Streptomyces sp. FR-008]|nr:hypothetical protein SFR_5551 [Streptomyces sp. FR-008]